MEPITILIVDDHPVAREGLRAMLDTDPELKIVGEAQDGAEALERIAELQPQVVLMDVRMPRMDGLEATSRLKTQSPTTAVIMMTNYDDEALVVDAVSAGAAGYLLKDASRDLLGHTIRAAGSGGILIKDTLLRKAIRNLTHKRPPSAGAPVPLTDTVEALTPREREVFELMAEGQTNKDIAGALGVAEVTVKKHVQSIIAKLHASDRTHAAITGWRIGLIK